MNAKEARELAESPANEIQKEERLARHEQLGEIVRHALAIIAGEASEGKFEMQLPKQLCEDASELSGDSDYLITELEALDYTVNRGSNVPSFGKFNLLVVSW